MKGDYWQGVVGEMYEEEEEMPAFVFRWKGRVRIPIENNQKTILANTNKK